MPPAGRPSSYTPDMAEAICMRLAMGESLRAICADDDMPDKATVLRWVLVNPEFRDQYARARELQAEGLVDDIMEISDDGTNDWMERNSEPGEDIGWRVNGEHIQRSKLRIDSRKWFASKVLPKKYGEKQVVEHTDADGKSPFAALMELIAANGRPSPRSNS